MLAPFVQELLIGCSLLMLVGWMGDVAGRWVRLGAQTDSSVAGGTRVHSSHSTYGPSGISGDRLFKVVYPERESH
jgi:hypothetical protein